MLEWQVVGGFGVVAGGFSVVGDGRWHLEVGSWMVADIIRTGGGGLRSADGVV